MALPQNYVGREYDKFTGATNPEIRIVLVGTTPGAGVALKSNYLTREKDKFVEDVSGNTAVNIILT